MWPLYRSSRTDPAKGQVFIKGEEAEQRKVLTAGREQDGPHQGARLQGGIRDPTQKSKFASSSCGRSPAGI